MEGVLRLYHLTSLVQQRLPSDKHTMEGLTVNKTWQWVTSKQCDKTNRHAMLCIHIMFAVKRILQQKSKFPDSTEIKIRKTLGAHLFTAHCLIWNRIILIDWLIDWLIVWVYNGIFSTIRLYRALNYTNTHSEDMLLQTWELVLDNANREL